MHIRYYCLIVFMYCVVFAGCAAQTQDVFLANQRKLGREFAAFVPPKNFSNNQTSPVSAPQATGSLTLQQALAAGLMHSPELASFAWDVRAAEARELQAGLLPNPEISTEVENFGGNNEMQGFKSAETTVQVSQLFELGGKRGYRKRAAELEKNLAGWEYEIKRLDVFEKISTAFWEVLAAQERAAIAESLLKLAEQSCSSVAEQVAVGKVPPVEEVQAKIALTTTELQCKKIKSDLQSARSRLALAVGTSGSAFEKTEGRFDAVAPLPELDKLQAALAESPEMLRWKAELEKRQTEVKLKDAGAIPDITMSAGPRYFNENNDKAWVAGLSVPIPLFNRNQGERQEARCNAAKAEEEQKAGFIKIRSDLTQTYQSCSSAFALAAALRDRAIPGAQQAFKVTREGYRQGKFSYLMVLDAQRTLFELKQQYVDTLADYHTNRVAIERLIGQPAQ
ncbi:MAG: TolC family protein [Deltaproteobacteria bacterium]|nr:TolC family protein [Deltaproteobacteria bacterium]